MYADDVCLIRDSIGSLQIVCDNVNVSAVFEEFVLKVSMKR